MSTQYLLEDQDWDMCVTELDRAVAADSTFALAWWRLVGLCLETNQAEKGELALQNAMKYLYKLPERTQFLIKSVYYVLKKDPEKEVAVLQMMIELYPEDLIGRQRLASRLTVRKRTDDAIAIYEEILEIDPSRSEYLHIIGRLYRNKGEFDKALEYYQRYTDKHPNLVRSFTPMADIHEYKGELAQAASYYNKALLIEPGDVRSLRRLGDIDLKLGKYKEALGKYDEALSVAQSAQERMEIFASMSEFYQIRGEMETSIDYLQKSWAERKKVTSPTQALISELADAHLFVQAGQTERAFEIVESARKQFQSPYDKLVPLGYLFLYLEIEEPDSAEVAFKGLKLFIDSYGLENLRDQTVFAKGRIAELRGEHEAAIKEYQTSFELTPTQTDRNVDMGRCFRKLGRLDEAEEAIQNMLKVFPFEPEALYELALIFAERGDQEKAIDALKKALTVWENADPVYKPAREAGEKLAEWTS
jgi:tetratricopeptide (TPR) repeat protein